MRDIGEHVLNAARDRFDSQTDPAGNSWEPLSDNAKRRKKRNEDKMLARDSDIRGNLACRTDRDSFESGGPSVHVGTHQFGALKGAFRTTSRGGPRNDIPMRPFLGLRIAPKPRNRRGTASTRPRGDDVPPPDRRPEPFEGGEMGAGRVAARPFGGRVPVLAEHVEAERRTAVDVRLADMDAGVADGAAHVSGESAPVAVVTHRAGGLLVRDATGLPPARRPKRASTLRSRRRRRDARGRRRRAGRRSCRQEGASSGRRR